MQRLTDPRKFERTAQTIVACRGTETCVQVISQIIIQIYVRDCRLVCLLLAQATAEAIDAICAHVCI